MRYVIVLLLLFTLKSTAVATTTTLPAATKLLEIRSLPEVRKPANRLLQRFLSLGGKNFCRLSYGGLFVGMAMSSAIGVDAYLATAIGFAMSSVGLVPFSVGIHRDNMTRSLYNRSRERQVFYTELLDGKVTLHFGHVVDYEYDTGMLIVESTDGENKTNQVYFKDVGGISVPDHQDLGRQVRLLTEADSDDNYLYDLGKVVEVYDEGHYEIEVDRKFSDDSVTKPIDKPYRVFVHASLQAHQGGFVFTDNEAASGHVINENVHIIAAAREVDRAQDETALEQGQAVER